MKNLLIFIVIINCVAALGQQRSWFVPIHTNSQPYISNIKTDLEGNVYIGGGLGPTTQVGDSIFFEKNGAGPKTLFKFDSLGSLNLSIRQTADSTLFPGDFFMDYAVDLNGNILFLNNFNYSLENLVDDTIISNTGDSFLYYYPGGNTTLPLLPPKSYYLSNYSSTGLRNWIELTNCSVCGGDEIIPAKNSFYVLSGLRFKAIIGNDTIIMPDNEQYQVWIEYSILGKPIDYMITDKLFIPYQEFSYSDFQGNIFSIASSTNNSEFLGSPLNAKSYYILKFKPLEKLLWKYEINFGVAHLQVLDNNGNVYITGEANTDFIFKNKTIAKGYFVIALSSSGEELWAKSFGDNFINDIEANKDGQIYITGSVESAYDFGIATFENNSTTNQHLGFICKVNSTGQFVWVTKVFDEPPFNTALNITSYEENIYLYGPMFTDSVTFNNKKFAHKFLGVRGGYVAKMIDTSYTTDIKQIKQKKPVFEVYPNPTNSVVNVSLNNQFNQEVEVFITDQLGKKIETLFKGHTEKNNTLDINLNLPSGIYFLTLHSQELIETKKLIIKKE